jgi:hypothetical protein
MSDDDEKMPRAASKLKVVVVLYVVLPMTVMLAVWLWIRHERAKVRDRGFGACVSAGREADWCESAADRNHERCMELTFKPANRTSGSGFDERGYVECLDIGAEAYWKLSAERAAERRRKPAP